MNQPRSIPQLSLQDFEQRFRDRHLLHAVLAKWARERPEQPAIISADSGDSMSWAELETTTCGLAMSLVELGYRKGDRFATLLPLLAGHIVLEYACFRIGVIFIPLDLRLSAAEIVRSMQRLRPKGFAFAGIVPPGNFQPLAEAVRRECGFVEHYLEFSPDGEGGKSGAPHPAAVESASGEAGKGNIPFAKMLARARELCPEHRRQGAGPGSAAKGNDELREAYERATARVEENDGALVIFTTGSTGSPKPALLSHRGIACQAMCISQAFFRGDSGMRTLVNLPPSHVGGQTELLMGTFFGGGTAVILGAFDPPRSLRAIQEHRVQVLGQIPAMFQFEWRLKEYDKFDLTSLEFVAYGGQQVSEAFVTRMASMAPWVGTGLGLTEASGFCTYQLRPREQASELLPGLGTDMPVYAASIRGEMLPDGRAGEELREGQIGHICFRGPQTFLQYLGGQEATARSISRDGFLYTGDLGFKDAGGLHLSGRAKWVIKPSGYQVFPADVETHFCALVDRVASCAVVGVAHAVVSEAIVAFVEKKPGAELSRAMLERHARGLASYMRPRHYLLLEPGEMPLNRVAKPDYVLLREMALRAVETLRAQGRWQ
ncbi:MAG: class I adenylate-forming enzyme family protein [Candidatus Korobacteraceae bacterium]